MHSMNSLCYIETKFFKNSKSGRWVIEDPAVIYVGECFAYIKPWLIHVNVWQKPLQYCKVINLQLIKINEKEKKNCEKKFKICQLKNDAVH